MVKFNRDNLVRQNDPNDKGHMKDGVLFYKGHTLFPDFLQKIKFKLGLLTAEEILTVKNKSVSK